MAIRFILAPILAFIFWHPSSAQDKKKDSLFAVLKISKGEERIKALNALANIVVYDAPDDAKKYALESIKLSKELSYEPGLGDAYTRIGIAYDVSGKYDSSIYYYEKALPIYNQLNNLKGRGSALNNLGLIYWNTADYDKALFYFFDALKDFESIGNEKYMANALNNIGLVYDDTKSYQKAIEYHLKARKIYEKLNDAYLKGAVYNNLGNSYSNLNQQDSAMYYFRNAIHQHLQAEDEYGLSIAYSGYATQLQLMGSYDSSLVYHFKALDLKDKMNEISGLSNTHVNIADIFLEKKDDANFIHHIMKAKDIAEKNNLKKDQINIYHTLAKYYELKDVQVSYDYFKRFNIIKDSVFNENSSRQIAELNTKYETGKKEIKLREQELLLARKNLLIWGIAASLILVLLTTLYLFKRSRFRQQRRLQEEVMKQQDIATKSVIAAEENERKRIAADLHDGVGQMMSAAKMNLSVFEAELPFTSAVQKGRFENVIAIVDECCNEIRSVSHQMMPNALLKSGLASAIKEFIDKIDNRVIRVTLHTEGLNERIDSNIETVLYRVIQECVNNVLKHSKANQLDISLIKDKDGIAATIEDNGSGFVVPDINQSSGIGLKNMVSRIAFLKGTVEIDSSPGKGTLIAIHVPVA